MAFEAGDDVNTMRYRLPPLNALRVFEAAGRHMSFKDAARELDITPSAVSHGVQTLEEWLGQPLFSRRKQGLLLTKAGSIYFRAATDALRCLSEGINLVPGVAARGRLTVSAAPTFAARLLLPRLFRLREHLQHVAVEIDTSPHLVEFTHSGIDVAIRLGFGDWEGLTAVYLLTERLVPVCSPGLKARSGSDMPFNSAPLIHLTAVSQDWRAWFEAMGQASADLGSGFRVDTIQLAIAAAVQGLGICMGRRPLIDEELASGALVECGPPVECRTSYYLVGPPSHFRRPEVAQFKEWLLSETSAYRG